MESSPPSDGNRLLLLGCGVGGSDVSCHDVPPSSLQTKQTAAGFYRAKASNASCSHLIISFKYRDVLLHLFLWTKTKCEMKVIQVKRG